MIAGQPCPFAGRISMDLMVFDVTDLPAGAVRRGMLATLIGDGIAVDDVAAGAAPSGMRCSPISGSATTGCGSGKSAERRDGRHGGAGRTQPQVPLARRTRRAFNAATKFAANR